MIRNDLLGRRTKAKDLSGTKRESGRLVWQAITSHGDGGDGGGVVMRGG